MAIWFNFQKLTLSLVSGSMQKNNAGWVTTNNHFSSNSINSRLVVPVLRIPRLTPGSCQ
jgi:hypothetical protein